MLRARLFKRIAPPPQRPVLVSDPVSLVAVAAEHYAQWRDAAASCEAYLRRWQPTWPHGHLGEESYRRRLALFERDWDRGAGAAFHIFEREVLVGALRLSRIERGAAQSCEVGYWIAERASGRGFATKALDAACAYAFGPLDLLRIEAACAVGNDASLRVLSRCGFVREGTARAFLEIDGVRRDHHRLACLSSGR